MPTSKKKKYLKSVIYASTLKHWEKRESKLNSAQAEGRKEINIRAEIIETENIKTIEKTNEIKHGQTFS